MNVAARAFSCTCPGGFLLDFLRVSDKRYLALTPAQWVAAVAMSRLCVARSRAMLRYDRIWLVLLGGKVTDVARRKHTSDQHLVEDASADNQTATC